MIENGQTRLHAEVYGRVQGVGFRAFVIETGVTLGVTGWARNKWDGSVEVIAEADRQTLESLLAALHRGPRMANVARVEVEWQPASGEFNSFHVRSTV
jgi:acylphosphatase